MQQEQQKVEDRVLINDVVIFGARFLLPKQLEIIKYALDGMPENDIQAIFITDTFLDDAIGRYCRATRTAAISLHEIMIDAIEGSMSDDIGLSLTARCWMGFIYTLWHELHHNVAMKMADSDQDDSWMDAEEELAKKFADDKVEPTLIECNAEMPERPAKYPLIDRILDFMVTELKDNPESEWVKTQKQRMDDGIVFENREDIFDSIVEYHRAASQTPERYERENKGAEIAVVANTMPNLFDQKMLPGDQGKLFPDNTPEVQEEYRIINEGEAAEMRLNNETIDDVDGLPPEAYNLPGGDFGNTLSAVAAQVARTAVDVAYESINMDVESGFGGLPGSSPEAMDYFMSNTEPMPGVDPSVTDVAQRQVSVPTTGVDPFAPQFAAPEVKNFPGGRNAEQFYTETGQDIANEKEVKVEVGYKKEDGSTGHKTLYPETTPVQSGMRDVLLNLYMRMYNHMFTAGVLQPLELTQTEKDLGVVVGCITAKDGGGWVTGDVKKAGYILGCLYKGGSVVAYDLILNWGGQEKRYKMISQNTAKNSRYAQMAKNGSKIVWILDAKEEDNSKSFKAKIIDGQYSLCQQR